MPAKQIKLGPKALKKPAAYHVNASFLSNGVFPDKLTIGKIKPLHEKVLQRIEQITNPYQFFLF